MIYKPDQLPPPPVGKRAALPAAIFVAFIIGIWIYWGHSNDLPSQLALPAPTGASMQAIPVAATKSAELSPSRASSQSRGGPSERGLLERFAGMLSEKRIVVCGLSHTEAAQFLSQELVTDIVGANAALAEATGKFLRSEQPRDRALGLYAQLNQVEWEARTIEGSNFKPCLVGTDCRSNGSTEESQRVRAVATNPLVNLALSGNDPAIYATAVHACNGRKSATCAQVTYAGWVKIEPNNAVAWLMVAAEASSTNDVTARDTALHRAGGAATFNPHLPALLPLFEADGVARQSPLAQSSIGTALVGMHVQPLLTLSNALATVCLRGESLDEARKIVCDKLASQFLDQDETVMSSMVAIAVGSKVGWQPERLQRYRDEAAVATGLSSDQNSIENPYSCESLARSVSEVRISFSKGERARAREYALASGRSLAELADEYRKKYPTLIK